MIFISILVLPIVGISVVFSLASVGIILLFLVSGLPLLIVTILIFSFIVKIFSAKNQGKDIFINKNKVKEIETYSKKILIREECFLTVLSQNGYINIEEWQEDNIEIEAIKSCNKQKRIKDIKININEGKHLLIESEIPKDIKDASVSYNIKVPNKVKLEKANSSNAKIILKNLAGDAQVRTSNGQIIVNNFKGSIDAKTSNASIDLHDVSKILAVTTSNARIRAEIIILEHDLTIKTSNGGIELAIAENVNAQMKAITSNAKVIVNDLFLKTAKMDNNNLVGTLGEGENKLSLITTNAKIIINKL